MNPSNRLKRNVLSVVGVSLLAAGIALASVAPASAAEYGPGFEAKRHVRIDSGHSAYGSMLFNGAGQAIYLFDKERESRSRCYGACSHAWPPVLTKGKPRATGKVRGQLLGTTKRKGGARQVTYNGHPLYYYVNEGPGQVFCHEVFQFGGTWLVLGPDGQAGD